MTDLGESLKYNQNNLYGVIVDVAFPGNLKSKITKYRCLKTSENLPRPFATFDNLQENINFVRSRAGVPLFTTANWLTNSYKITNLLDLVLTEKRLEMIGECQRTKDLYRNKRDLIRTYRFDGDNYLDTYTSGSSVGTISRWNSKQIIRPIPYGQIIQSPNMTQNPY